MQLVFITDARDPTGSSIAASTTLSCGHLYGLP